jgi:hypothetical protein
MKYFVQILPEKNSMAAQHTSQDAATAKDALKENPLTRLHNFGMESAFFVLMGGDVLLPVEPDCIPVTLTLKGFIQLYEADRIFEYELDPSLIIDIAKVDGLAKVIVCFQATVNQPYHVAEEFCANILSGLHSKALGDSRAPSRPRF